MERGRGRGRESRAWLVRVVNVLLRSLDVGGFALDHYLMKVWSMCGK